MTDMITDYARVIAEYQRLGEGPSDAWAQEVLGRARDAGLIEDFTVLGSFPGPDALELVLFTVDLPISDDRLVTTAMDYAQAREVAQDLLNRLVVHDIDVDVRWVSHVNRMPYGQEVDA